MYKGGQVNSELACKGFNNTDLSPYNSKFTVLRFSQQKSNSSHGKVKTPNLRPFELSPELPMNTISDNVVMSS